LFTAPFHASIKHHRLKRCIDNFEGKMELFFIILMLIVILVFMPKIN